MEQRMSNVTLRTLPAKADTSDVKTQLKKRISFSGKNSVRIFSGEEEPKTWNNSYEISDSLSGSETATNYVPSKARKLQKCKEDLDMCTAAENNRMCLIENSVDITLSEIEKKFQTAKFKNNDIAYSFSLEDHENDDRSIVFVEKTFDFMRELNKSNERVNNSVIFEFEDAKVFVHNEYADQNPYHDFTCSKEADIKEPIKNFMNNTLPISSNEQATINNINPHKTKVIQHSRTNDEQFHKENMNDFSMQIANETQNNCCQMEVKEEIFPDSQSSEHLNTTKFYPPIYMDQEFKSSIEFSHGKNIHVNADHSRLGIHFNQFIQDGIHTSKGNENNASVAIPRPTIYFNQGLEISPVKLGTTLDRLNLSQSIRDDTKASTVRGCNRNEWKVKSHSTIYFNQTLELSPLRLKNDLNRRKTLNIISVLPEKLSQEPAYSKNLNVSATIPKCEHQPKLVVRNICDMNRSKTKNILDFGQLKLDRYREKQTKNMTLNVLADNSKTVVERETGTNTNTSLSFSLDSTENISLVESSSPLMPMEYKCYSLMQLNDEIELGNIKVFSNAPKTPLTDRKDRINTSVFRLKRFQSRESPFQNRRTLIFEDEDIPVSSEETLYKSNNLLHCNTSVDRFARGRTNNGKCPYSQMDDIMLDNTSFFTNAKLSDETVSRDSSKRDISQIRDSIDIFNESLPENSSKLDGCALRSSAKLQKSCNNENYALSYMFPNVRPIADIKDSSNSANSYDAADIFKDMRKDYGKNVEGNKLYSAQILYSKTEECGKHVRQTLCFSHDIVQSDLETSIQPENFEDERTISNESTENTVPVKNKPISVDTNSTTKTFYFDESINNFLNPFEKNQTTIEQIVQVRNTESSKLNPTRKTLFFNNEMSVENLSREVKFDNEKSDIVNMSTERNVPAVVTDKNNYNLTNAKEPLYFNNIMEEKFNSVQESAEPSNCAKMALLRQLNKSKFSNKLDNTLITPRGKINSLLCITPRLSLLEFTSLENKIKEESETNCKRLSFTLTPVFSVIKKRHTLEFENSRLDDLAEPKRQSPELINTRCVNNDAMEMSGVISNGSSLPIWLNKSTSFVNISNNNYINIRSINEDAVEISDMVSSESGISMPINKSVSLIDTISNNHKDMTFKFVMDTENIAESIQLIRTAEICSPNNNVISEKIENVQLNERNFNSSHYMETFRDEDSFILPKLPPTPNLRLDILGKLFERQTIMDDVAFWERGSLDCTTDMSYDDTQLISNSDDEAEDENNAVTKAIVKYEKNILRYKKPSASRLPFVLRLDVLLRNHSTNWICDYQMQYRGILQFTHKKTLTLAISLIFEELDNLGYDVSLQSVKLGISNLSKKYWKPIDFFIEFQLKLNLPYNLKWLLKGNNEVDAFQMLKKIDQLCLETLQMGNSLQRICYTNQASIVRDGGRTCVHKIVREVVNGLNNDLKCVKKTVINIELLNIKTLSFKDILIPRLHHFQEKIHLLPTGLQFLQNFLLDPLNYLKIF